jgi:short-subunit dehydrogenase
MIKTAIVTGASSGIGLEIAKALCEKGYEVFGLARDFKKCEFNHDNFIQRECDITNQKEITYFWELMKKKRVDILVHSAGVGYFGLHENISFDKIEKMIDTSLKAPLYISKLFIHHLKESKGYIFNINSISAIKSATYGAVYGATKAGLKHFGNSLFNEYRKSGIKVVNIEPDITKTPWFEDKNFTYHDSSDTVIEPKEIAKIVLDIISLKSVVTDIVIQPQKFRIEKK